ncbi:MAG TPA: hypothetical protein VG013_25345 [Gemmataceae bacterium]|nr:hypothetical protein [Gemmataceae bacterium]
MSPATASCREEAERLGALDADTQRHVIAMDWSMADDRSATKADRRTAKERADALARFLGLARRKR